MPAERFVRPSKPSADPLVALTASSGLLITARASGKAMCFSLPHMRCTYTFDLGVRPLRMQLNCDSTRLLCVDTNGALA